MRIYSCQIRSSLSFVVWSYDLFCGLFYILWTYLSLNLVPHVGRMRGEIGDRRENGLCDWCSCIQQQFQLILLLVNGVQKGDLPQIMPVGSSEDLLPLTPTMGISSIQSPDTSDGFWLIFLLLPFSFFFWLYNPVDMKKKKSYGPLTNSATLGKLLNISAFRLYTWDCTLHLAIITKDVWSA